MRYRRFYTILSFCLMGALWGWAADFAPAVPDLTLPGEEVPAPAVEEVVPAVVEEKLAPAPAPAPVPVVAPKKTSAKRQARPAAPKVTKPVVEEKPAAVAPADLAPAAVVPPAEPAKPVADAAEILPQDLTKENFVPARETTASAPAKKAVKVAYAPSKDRDPTLSPMDIMTIKRQEAERLRAIEMEKQRRLEAERRRLAELERLRQLELERLRDPSKEIRGKIRINGIIGQEVFVGNKVYTVGGTVLGAKIISIQPDAVVFLYKGQKFTKTVQLK